MISEKYDIFFFELNNAIVDIEKYQYFAWLKTLNMNFSFEYFCNKFHPKDFDSIRYFLLNKLNLNNYGFFDFIKYSSENYNKLITKMQKENEENANENREDEDDIYFDLNYENN